MISIPRMMACNSVDFCALASGDTYSISTSLPAKNSGACANIFFLSRILNALSISGFNNSDCNLPNTGPNNLIFSSFLCITSVAVICGPCCIMS